MAKPLVLITGATGHIGFRTLAKLLEAGYRARVTSRKLASAAKLKELPSIKPHADSVEFIEVPDFLAEGAFDEAVKDVEYVLHLASPIPDTNQAGTSFDLDNIYLKPAIQGTVGMLKAASKSPTVKRVVITSSVAILDRSSGETPVGPDNLGPLPTREEMQSNPWIAYRGSKILANEAAEKYVAENKPHYDVVNILPAYVQGRNETVTTVEELVYPSSSNHTMVRYVLGYKSQGYGPTAYVHVDDVAAVEVAALDPAKAKHGERFIAAYPAFESYREIDPVVKKLFPDEVKSGLLPLGGEQAPAKFGFDASKTTRRMGIEFQGLEAMVKSVIGQYVELATK